MFRADFHETSAFCEFFNNFIFHYIPQDKKNLGVKMSHLPINLFCLPVNEFQPSKQPSGSFLPHIGRFFMIFQGLIGIDAT